MNFVNIEIEQGTSYLFQLVYTDDITGLPKDLTGYTATLNVKPYATSPAAISLSTTGTTITLGGVTGQINAYFAPETTATAEWTRAPFDLILKDSLQVAEKIVKGFVTILPSESI